MTPRYNWNIAKFGIKHQSINQSINQYFYMNLRMMRVNLLHCNTLFLGPSWSWSYGSWIYNYLCNQCLSPLIVLDTTLFDKDCQWLVTGWWFSLGTPVSSTNKTDRHDIIEILLVTIRKVKPLFLILLYHCLKRLHYWLNMHIIMSQILIFGLLSSKVITY
jgi:hypothetical protein